MEEMWVKRSCQIPAFGDWETVNEMPITQYFESARQAGLLRYSSSSGECDAPPVAARDRDRERDLYSVDHFKKPRTSHAPAPPTKERRRGRRCCQHEEHVKQAAAGEKQGGGGRKVFDVTVTEKEQQQQFPNNKRRPAVGVAVVSTKQQQQKSDVASAGSEARIPRRAPKAVDEDLYKIPPHLLRSSHRKKKLGFISRCWVLPCAV